MPRQPTISRDRVLDATLSIAERRGLGAVSMRSVAARLGVSPMALYHHVRDKDDLLDGLVERLLAELPLPDPTLPWDARLRALAQNMRETARRHPDAFVMLLRRPATTPGARRVRDAACAALGDAGVPDDFVPRLERLLSSFMLGFAASEAGGRLAHHGPETLDADLAWAEAQVARMLGDAGA